MDHAPTFTPAQYPARDPLPIYTVIDSSLDSKKVFWEIKICQLASPPRLFWPQGDIVVFKIELDLKF